MDKSSIQICCFAQDSIRYVQICSKALCLLRDQGMIKHCTAGRKTGIRGLDLRLGHLNSNKMFKAVLFELTYNDPILIYQILAKCNGQFGRSDFAVWAALKQYIEVILRTV